MWLSQRPTKWQLPSASDPYKCNAILCMLLHNVRYLELIRDGDPSKMMMYSVLQAANSRFVIQAKLTFPPSAYRVLSFPISPGNSPCNHVQGFEGVFSFDHSSPGVVSCRRHSARCTVKLLLRRTSRHVLQVISQWESGHRRPHPLSTVLESRF